MIARLSFAVLMIVLSGWLYLLTALVMRAIDRAEQLIDREHRALPEDETPEAEGGDWYAKLRAGAEWANARMQPTFLEPEVIEDDTEAAMTEPAPVVAPRPSPVPREPAPETVPMERAWEESAAELTEQQQWEVEQEAKYAAAMARIEEMAKGLA